MFKVGKFLVIQGRDSYGELRFIKVEDRNNHNNRTDSYDHPRLCLHEDPFKTTIWYHTDDISEILEEMRIIRLYCGRYDIDPNSLKIVIVKTSVQNYVPERDSDEEIELRKYILEKLTEEEKDILRLTNWEVFHKLADRSNMESDSD